jgi:hypothetical protein
MAKRGFFIVISRKNFANTFAEYFESITTFVRLLFGNKSEKGLECFFGGYRGISDNFASK